MLLIDDLVLGPLHGLLWVVEKVHEAAQEELAGEADAITEELRQLYLQLEAGRISEAEFEEKERPLLDRLDEIREDGEDDEEDDEDDADGEGADEEGAAAADTETSEAASPESGVDEDAVDPTASPK